MNFKLLFLLLVITISLSAQTYTEVSQIPPFDGISEGSIAFVDVDGDNDQDVLITGRNSSGNPISKLYTNDGFGAFTESLGTPFEEVTFSSIAFVDVDGDNDQDVLITGRNSSFVSISKLYTNNGFGTFTESLDTPFDGVSFSSIAFADIDGDNDQDLLITGRIAPNTYITKLYTNDGLGAFTESLDTPFEGVAYSSIAFSDVDGDNDQDVLIIGLNSLSTPVSKLYINDGFGAFTEYLDTEFEGFAYGSIAFSDVDGDDDQDVLITGQNSLFDPISKLYINNGLGAFTEFLDTPFEEVTLSSIAFSDVDGDNDQDVLITGRNSLDTLVSKLYTNDGFGIFTESLGAPFDGVVFSSIAFGDIDGDYDEDVLITGQNNLNDPISKLYTKDGEGVSNSDLINGFNLDCTPYPNPTKSNKINISFESAKSGSVTVKVYDLKGHILSQQKESVLVGLSTISIDIASLTNGTYFIELDNGNRRGIAKIIIQ